jgi:hypothetical protein
MKKYVLFVLTFVMLATSTSRASFEENARRYLSAQEILWSLSIFFDFSTMSNGGNGNDNICAQIDRQNAPVAGVNSPKTGEPISPVPSQGTVAWIAGCVTKYLSTPDSLARDTVRLKNLVGEDTYRQLSSRSITMALQIPWQNWGPSEKKVLIKYMVAAFLGNDEVIADFGFIKDTDTFREKLLQAADTRTGATVLQIISFLSVNLALRDEFLSY